MTVSEPGEARTPGGRPEASAGPGCLRRVLAGALLLTLLLGVLTMVISPSMAEHFLFFPDGQDAGPPPTLAGVDGERVGVTASDGREIFGWHYPAQERAPTVLLLHGNAANVANRAPLARGLVQRGLGVFMLEYRGYGGAGGTPTIEGVVRDARAGLDRAAELAGGSDRLVLFGRSLGGAVGMQVLEGPEVAAVILESTFTSLEEVAQAAYPILPDFVFRRLRGVLDTRVAVEGLEAPVLVVHGTADGIVPFAMGEALRDAAPGPREWYPVRGAGHNDVHDVGGDAYFERLAEFIRGWTEAG